MQLLLGFVVAKVKNAVGDIRYAIDAEDWMALTGETPDDDPVMVNIVPVGWSTCDWEYNDEFERWETECEDVIALHGGESPFEYGFKFCPYCGKKAVQSQ